MSYRVSKELSASAKSLSSSRECFIEVYIDNQWIIVIVYLVYLVRNIRLGSFWIIVANAQAYYVTELIVSVIFYKVGPKCQCFKLFFFVSVYQTKIVSVFFIQRECLPFRGLSIILFVGAEF